MVRMRCREEQAPTGKHMGECILSLRGWHPALAQAELSALFPQGEVKPLSSPRLAGLKCSKEASELQISSGIEAVFMDGVNIEWSNEEQVLHRIAEYLEQFPHDGTSCAVHAWKHGEGIEGCSRTIIAGMIGGILSLSLIHI